MLLQLNFVGDEPVAANKEETNGHSHGNLLLLS